MAMLNNQRVCPVLFTDVVCLFVFKIRFGGWHWKIFFESSTGTRNRRWETDLSGGAQNNWNMSCSPWRLHEIGSFNCWVPQNLWCWWWRFQKIGAPPVLIHFNRIFHHKPSIWGTPMSMETPISTTETPMAQDHGPPPRVPRTSHAPPCPVLPYMATPRL